MDSLAYTPLAEAARLIAAKDLSPVEYTRALLRRIAAIDSDYNAFISVTEDIALAEAKAAEAEIVRGRYRGPMHGIPYAIKDIIDVAGLPTTCHSKLRLTHRAETDAFVVRRLREAGAVLLGKLALHEFATGGPAFDLPWPPARNPWDRQLHPGGSSSGSAAALAAGMVPATLGTDTGGSVRNPATCCGIVGFKPTYGVVGMSGVFPLALSLDHVGPMTRTVEDNAILFQAICGRDGADPVSADRVVPDCLANLHQGVKGLRIGVIEHLYARDMQAGEAQIGGIENAIGVLRNLGADIQTVEIAPFDVWKKCFNVIRGAEGFEVHESDLRDRSEDFADLTRRRLLPGASVSAMEYIRAQNLRRRLTRDMENTMRDFDAVITLSSYDLPTKIDDAETTTRFFDRHCRFIFNLTGMPAIAVPTGLSKDRIPLSMQIAGAAFNDHTVYRVAHAFCAAAGTTIGLDSGSQPDIRQG